MTPVAVTDYTGLLTSEHAAKPKFSGLVGTDVGLPVDGRNALQAMPAAFDVDAAIGVQLDAVGQWVGLPRVVTVQPSDAFPAAAPYQVAFSDAEYRRLLKARALANRWDGTPGGAVTVLAAFFGAGYAAILDNQDMSVDLYLTMVPGATAAEAAVFAQFLLPLRPAGVRVRQTWVSPSGPLFGLDIENSFVSGPSVGSFGSAF